MYGLTLETVKRWLRNTNYYDICVPLSMKISSASRKQRSAKIYSTNQHLLSSHHKTQDLELQTQQILPHFSTQRFYYISLIIP